VLVLLQIIGDWIARAGRRRQETEAVRELADADHAWTLVARPANWTLWMPAVRDLLDGDRPPRSGARYRVALRLRGGRLGLGTAKEGHVVVDSFDPDGRIAWRLLTGRHEERYELIRTGARFTCRAHGGEPAAEVVGELAREAAPL
jgi:hypothetical protein